MKLNSFNVASGKWPAVSCCEMGRECSWRPWYSALWTASVLFFGTSYYSQFCSCSSLRAIFRLFKEYLFFFICCLHECVVNKKKKKKGNKMKSAQPMMGAFYGWDPAPEASWKGAGINHSLSVSSPRIQKTRQSLYNIPISIYIIYTCHIYISIYLIKRY